ncbi:MAG: hypothetical protein ACLGH8_01225 [Bacteroidia bacterium]
MKNTLPNLNGFPTDNAPSTQLKYDIIASKFMTGIHNYQRRNAPVGFGVSGCGFAGRGSFGYYCFF